MMTYIFHFNNHCSLKNGKLFRLGYLFQKVTLIIDLGLDICVVYHEVFLQHLFEDRVDKIQSTLQNLTDAYYFESKFFFGFYLLSCNFFGSIL